MEEATYLALTKRPEIHAHAHQIVDGRIRGLIQQDGHQGAERVKGQPRLDAAMDGRAGDELHGPLPGQADDAQEQVDHLQGGDGLDGAVEVFGRKVPEDLGPEETLDGSGDLIGGGGEEDEARPVVFDEFAHP